MLYCDNSIQALVTYTINNKERIYKATNCPVDVSTNEKSINSNGYDITGSSVTVPLNWTEAKVWIFGNYYSNPDTCPIIVAHFEVGTAQPGQSLSLSYRNFSGGCPNAVFADIVQIGYYGNQHQFPSASLSIGLKRGTQKKYYITITEANGSSYEEFSDTPITFNVACDNDCPEGFMKCDYPFPPGFKCEPCDKYLSRLIAIENKIR